MELCDSYEQKAEKWNERLELCIKQKFGTKNHFKEVFSERYEEIPYQQVSRWCRVNHKTGSRDKYIGFPNMKNMCRIAELLDVDLGYLLGEQEETAFTMQQACEFTGLNSNSINAILNLTVAESRFDKDPSNNERARQIFDRLLSLGAFRRFIKELYVLDNASVEIHQHANEMEKKLENKLGIELFGKAVLWSTILDAGYEGETPDSNIIDAVHEVQALIDSKKEMLEKLELEEKAQRFAISEVYTRMIDEFDAQHNEEE